VTDTANETPSTDATDSVIERHPNAYVASDHGMVTWAGGLLIAAGAVELAFAIALIARPGFLGQLDEIVRNILIFAALGEGWVILACGVLTLRNWYAAAVTGLVLMCLALAVWVANVVLVGLAVGFDDSAFFTDLVVTGIRVLLVVVVAYGVGAVKRINQRIGWYGELALRPPTPASPEDRWAPARAAAGASAKAVAGTTPPESVPANPLIPYYHLFIRLLVRVMRADGLLDRRERLKIAEVCDAMQISSYERDRVILAAGLDPASDIEEQTRRYVEAAEALEIPGPRWQLVLAAIGVAGADGVIELSEQQVVLDIGAAVGIAEGEIRTILDQQVVDPDHLDAEEARRLLALPEGATPGEIEGAHESLSSSFAEGDYLHLGGRLEDFVTERQRVLDGARAVLLG